MTIEREKTKRTRKVDPDSIRTHWAGFLKPIKADGTQAPGGSSFGGPTLAEALADGFRSATYHLSTGSYTRVILGELERACSACCGTGLERRKSLRGKPKPCKACRGQLDLGSFPDIPVNIHEQVFTRLKTAVEHIPPTRSNTFNGDAWRPGPSDAWRSECAKLAYAERMLYYTWDGRLYQANPEGKAYPTEAPASLVFGDQPSPIPSDQSDPFLADIIDGFRMPADLGYEEQL